MAAPCSTTTSYLGIMSAGTMLDGKGFAPATQGIGNRMFAAGGSYLADIDTARTNAAPLVDAATETALDELGSAISKGSGAFSNSTPVTYTSLVGKTGINRITAHGNLMFDSNPLKMAQTVSIAESLTYSSAQLAPSLEKLANDVKFGRMPGLDELVYPEDGIFPNYLGKGYPDFQAVVTNGISTLFTTATSENFNLLATDFLNLGNVFNLENISVFRNPGQVVASANSLNALTVSGLAEVMAYVGIDPAQIYNLSSSAYNQIMMVILKAITNPKLIANTQSLLGSNISNMESLADYTNFDKVFVNSKDVISFSNFEELREKLSLIELGQIQSLAQLGTYIASVAPVTLPTISNNSFVFTTYLSQMTGQYLGGTGPNGRITISDMVGILGGVGIDSQATDYKTAMDNLNSAGVLDDLKTRISQLNAGINGDYSSGVDPNITITDPNGLTHGPGAEETVYSAFVNHKIGQIETELDIIYALSTTNQNVNTAITNWETIFAKVNSEKTFQNRIDMNYGTRTTYPDNAYSFATNLKSTINNSGKLELITGMINQAVSNGDEGGEILRAYITELQNRSVGDAYDIRWRAELCE